MADNNYSREFGCSADLVRGEEIELTFRAGDGLWIAIGAGIGSTDFWLKGQDAIPDIRVRVDRVGDEIQILLDRGQQSTEWWPFAEAPRIKIMFDPSRNLATAVAGIGSGENFQEVLLGKRAY